MMREFLTTKYTKYTKRYRGRDGGIPDALIGLFFVWFVFFVVHDEGVFNHERHEIHETIPRQRRRNS